MDIPLFQAGLEQGNDFFCNTLYSKFQRKNLFHFIFRKASREKLFEFYQMVSRFYQDNKGRETRQTQTPTHFIAHFGDIDIARNFFKTNIIENNEHGKDLIF